MNILIATLALAAAQAAPVDHKQHSPADHARHQQGQNHADHKGKHECCKKVNGKMECQMMKGQGADHQGHDGQKGHAGH